jgi:putative endonuclease
MPHYRQAVGTRGEAVVAVYLAEHGFRILHQNYRNHYGEIDLIVQRAKELHFVEIKTRQCGEEGEPFDWITPHKQRRIARIADAYLGRERVAGLIPTLSAAAVNFATTPPTIEWLPNAFDADG